MLGIELKSDRNSEMLCIDATVRAQTDERLNGPH